MSTQLMNAINNRDGAALSRMAGNHTDSQKVINPEAERLVDALFNQLKQIFPAAVSTSLRDEECEKTTKRQWVVAFAENGIRTREQVSAGVRHARASDSAFWPSPGQFIKWCKDSSTILGVTLEDVMAEFRRYSNEKGLHSGGPERFPWSKPVMYWIVCDTRRAMYTRQLSEVEVEKFASKQLAEWSRKVSEGQSIPDPVARLESKSEVIPTANLVAADEKKFRYMPDARVLGSVTPAQWLYGEYKRRKALGMV